MKFTMAICTHKYTFIKLFFHLLPTSRVSFRGDSEVFLLWITMMKFERLNTLPVATEFATSATVSHSLSAKHLSPSLNGSDLILTPICVLACVTFHTPPHSRMLYH